MKAKIAFTVVLLGFAVAANSQTEKISSLPAAGAVTGAELIPCVQSSSTVACTPLLIANYYNAATATITSKTYFNPVFTGTASGNGTSGSGAIVLATSPTLVTPNLGTPSSINLANATGLPASALPNPTSSTLGGVESYATVSNQWINAISTSGVPSSSQPAFSNLSGSAVCTQLPALTGNVTTTAGSCTTTIASGAVTLAMQANFAAVSLLGNPTGSLATPSAITLGAGLAFSGTTLVATGGGGGGGTVTSMSVATANGMAGSVATATTTPLVTLSTTFTGIGYSSGGGWAAAVAANFPTLNQSTTGNAATATALAATPAQCATNSVTTGVQANGTANCSNLSSLPSLPSLSTVGTIGTGVWNGTPVSVPYGGTGLTSGTSGGILGFTSSTGIASSGVLATNTLIVGGGAGATPTSLSGSGVPVLASGVVSVDAYVPLANGGCGVNVNEYSTTNTLCGYGLGTVTGARNTFYGYGIGSNTNPAGTDNTFVGSSAGLAAANGSYNTGLGSQALSAANLTGSGNTGLGEEALGACTSCANNTAAGDNAGAAITTGGTNVSIGNSVDSATLTTGSNNVHIGTSNAIDGATGSESNTIKIGAGGAAIISSTGTGTPSTSVTTIAGSLGTGAVAIASLPTCNSGLVGKFMSVNNGVASPTYFGAVSTTGAATDPVYCNYNGTSYGWVYH